VASCLPAWRRFLRASEHVQETQASLLSNYLQTNKDTEYGRLRQFHTIHSPEQFQKQIPLSTYDDYTQAIARIGEGQPAILSAGPVQMFELSSGSTAASKLIPYNKSLKAEFQRGIAAWIYNLYTNIPELGRGPAYWSITPLMDGKRFSTGGIPIGFETDSAYLGLFGKLLVDAVMATPGDVKNISNIDSFRYVTLLSLLRQPNLRLISVWNPTYLSLLLAPLSEWWGSLLRDIEHGTISRPEVELRFAPSPELARRLRKLDSTDYAAIWPRLRLISCWMGGASATYAHQLAETFPHVQLQGKGLLATEAFVSIPLIGVEGSALSINSHFFEFINDQGAALLAHQIEKGKTYSVVITTGGGFYRYQLHDVVEVTGHWQQIPCIRFVGKADHVSDWFGEKLDERFVANVLEKMFMSQHIAPVFAMLAPEEDGGFRYVLYIESADGAKIHPVALDQALRENFHYDYCRKLGQLAQAQVIQVTHAAESFLRAQQAHGQKLGNIKPSMLQKNTGWRAWFTIKMQ
jgi:hypothetical protein